MPLSLGLLIIHLLSPWQAQNTLYDIPELFHPQHNEECGVRLSQEHFIIFRASGGAIFIPAGTVTSINDFSASEPKAQVKYSGVTTYVIASVL